MLATTILLAALCLAATGWLLRREYRIYQRSYQRTPAPSSVPASFKERGEDDGRAA